MQQLSVLTTPAGATVRIDGASRGVTPWTGELPPGSHRLELQASGYRDSTQVFELPAQHAIDIIFELVPIRLMAVELGPFEIEVDVSTEDGATSGPRWWTWAAFGGSAALLVGAGALRAVPARPRG